MKRKAILSVVVLILAVAAFIVGRRARRERGDSGLSESASSAKKSLLGVDYFSKRSIGRPAEGTPWITDLTIVDLDGDGLKDILVCDARRNRVSWIRQTQLGVFEEQDIGDTIAGPAHVEVADLNGDGL